MKARSAAVLLAVLIAVTAFAPAAEAKSKVKRLSVTMSSFPAPDCTVAPDQVRMAIGFQAIVKRKNVKLPSRVTVMYKVTDSATGQVRVAERVTLKPKDYINIGSFLGFTVGSSAQLDASFTYKSTVNGRRYTAKNSQAITLPTSDELVAGGIKSCI